MPVYDAGRPAAGGEGLATVRVGKEPSAGPADGLGARPGGAGRLLGPAGRLLGRVPRRWRLPLATYLACQVISLLWWAAFFPGLLSYDSVIYVLHVTTGPWVDNHSVLYDALVWLSLHATGGLAGLTFGQTVVMSAALGYTVAAFRWLGVRGRWTAIAAVAVAVLPATGTLIIFVWKDTGFTICAFLMVPTLAHLISVRRQPGWHRDRRVNRLVAVLGLELAGLALFRPNGFLFVALAAIPLVCLLPGVRGRLAAAAAAAICLAAVLNLAVYPAAGIQRPPAALTLGPAYADIAVAYAERPASFTASDKHLMARVAPLAEWAKTADCYDSDTTTSIPGFYHRSAKVSGQLFALWRQLLVRDPGLVAGARICRASIAWNIFPGPPRVLGETLIPAISVPANLFGLGSRHDVRHNHYRHALNARPLSSTLHRGAESLWQASRTPQLEWLLWRGPLWCYLAYLAVFLYARARRNWQALSLAAIVAAQQLGVLADNPAQLYRYMASTIVIGIMLVPLFAALRRPGPRRRWIGTSTMARDGSGPESAGQPLG